MIYIKLNVKIMLFALMILMVSPAEVFAGDIMSAGTTLKEDSYVFSIEEATDLLKRVEELESKEKQLEHYIELDTLSSHKFLLYDSNIELLGYQISEYDKLVKLNSLEVDRLHKRAKFNSLENYGMLVLGMVITTAGFIVVDKITDNAILP